jgi:hypothetical protein
MKTVVLGDTHGRSLWKLITHTEKPDRVVFIGDYFDSFEISGFDQIQNFKDIVHYKETSGIEVVMLVGNHDYHYMTGIDEQYSGYQNTLAPSISEVLEQNKHHLQMAYQFKDFLFTHAGVSGKFLNSVFGKGEWNVENIVEDINELYKYKPRTFMFGAAVSISKSRWLDPYGDNTEQSPIWIRPRSLMSANMDTLKNKVIQIVGHTQVSKITDDIAAEKDNRYWFIDCLGTSGQYMVIEDDQININKI